MESKEISRDTKEVNENNYVLIGTDHSTGHSTKLTPTETVQIISDNFSRIKGSPHKLIPTVYNINPK